MEYLKKESIKVNIWWEVFKLPAEVKVLEIVCKNLVEN